MGQEEMKKPEEGAKVEVEVTTPPSKKEAFMRKYFADKKFDTEDDFFGQADADYEDARKNSEIIGKLNDALTKDPRTATFLKALVTEGEDAVMSYLNEYGEEEIAEMMASEEGRKKLAEAHSKALEAKAESDKFEKEYADNLAKSQECVNGLIEEGYLTEDELNQVVDIMEKFKNSVANGIVDKEVIDIALASVRHDKDVNTAAADAEIKGRNEKIAAEVKKPMKGDGLPMFGGGAKKPAENNKPDMGALDRAGGMSIFDRGKA